MWFISAPSKDGTVHAKRRKRKVLNCVLHCDPGTIGHYNRCAISHWTIGVLPVGNVSIIQHDVSIHIFPFLHPAAQATGKAKRNQHALDSRAHVLHVAPQSCRSGPPGQAGRATAAATARHNITQRSVHTYYTRSAWRNYCVRRGKRQPAAAPPAQAPPARGKRNRRPPPPPASGKRQRTLCMQRTVHTCPMPPRRPLSSGLAVLPAAATARHAAATGRMHQGPPRRPPARPPPLAGKQNAPRETNHEGR